MGKKFRNRFRGLCPCTKTSPTSEVQDGGKMDNGRKVGVQEKQPNHPIVKNKSQPLTKFDQKIIEIEAMYANLIEKLDHRHKRLNELNKVIFGGNFSLKTTIQVDASVQTGQPKPNTILTRGGQENGYSDGVTQPNININSLEDKPNNTTHKVKEPYKKSSISDAILYRWMTNHKAASENNKGHTMQPSIKTTVMKHDENYMTKHDQVEEDLYFIERLFIVDPRISHVSKTVRVSKTDLKFMNATQNMDQAIGLKDAKGDSSFRMQIVKTSNIAMVHKVDTPCIIADPFVSPQIRAHPIIFDLCKVYGIVAERNQLSGYFPTSKRVEKMGN